MSEVGVSFYEQHAAKLGLLFEVLGMPSQMSGTLESAVEATQPWVQGDHHHSTQEVNISGTKAVVAEGLFKAFGLTGERSLVAGKYDQLLVLGGLQLGNNRRIEFLRDKLLKGVRSDHIILLGGERKIDYDRESAEIERAKTSLIAQQASRPDPWIEQLEAGTVSLRWETDFLRLAATEHLGKLTVMATQTDVDKPWHTPERLDCGRDGQIITLLHTKAVERPQGKPRHTTEACIEHWLRSTAPETGARVGFVTANPYAERTGRVVNRVMRTLDRSDIELIVAGPEPSTTLTYQNFLREIAYNLYEDQRDLAETS